MKRVAVHRVSENSVASRNVTPSRRAPLLERLHNALGPIAGALVLDFADLATFGPIGLVAGGIVGLVIGWWISSIYSFRFPARILWAILAAIYCTIPFTALLPLATIISAVARFQRD